MKLSEYLYHELGCTKRPFADNYEIMFTAIGGIDGRVINNKWAVIETLQKMSDGIRKDLGEKIDRVANTEWEKEK